MSRPIFAACLLMVAACIPGLPGFSAGTDDPEPQAQRPEPEAPPPRPETPWARAEREKQEAEAAHRRYVEADVECPEDMSVQPGPRSLDTRKHPSNGGRSVFAKGHQEPPLESFFVSKEEAIEAVIALEKKHPRLLPAGFREQLLAEPRNEKLRLRVARCELDHDESRRRASYDAAMALLLGADEQHSMALLVESTKNGTKQRYVSTCGGGKCPTGETCDPVHEECVSETKKKVVKISSLELEIEHALTRALTEPLFDQDVDELGELMWWGFTRVHRCENVPNAMCHFTKYAKHGGTVLVHWDVRDGGASHSPPPRVQDWYRKNCQRGSITKCWKKKPSWVP